MFHKAQKTQQITDGLDPSMQPFLFLLLCFQWGSLCSAGIGQAISRALYRLLAR